jgi:hypothetical protein
MTDFLFEFSKSMGMPINDVLEAFQSLKSSGFMYTPAKTAKEFATRKYPFRVAGMPPEGLRGQSEVSFGPFAIEREFFERVRENLQEPDVFQVYLAYIRLAYEKMGGLVGGAYQFQTSEEDSLDSFLSMIELWDTDKPVICERFVWITPNEKCKRAVEKMLGKKFAKNDYSWWNIRFDLGTDITLTTPSDYPEEYSLLPSELTGPWAKYLPAQTQYVIMFLYLEMTKGGKLKSFSSLNDVLQKIQELLDEKERPKKGFPASFFDRELLIKELYDYNSLTYPVDATSTLEFLQQTGFIKVIQSKGSVDYVLTAEIENPKKILKVPKGWDARMSKFLTSGSVLFSYLSTEEIIKNT